MSSSSFQSTQIYRHPNPQETISPLLRSHLPYSIPIYRRIQHHLSLSPSSSACTVATFPPGAAPIDATNIQNQKGKRGPWLVAWIDLFRGPETQIWIFHSVEVPGAAAGETEHDLETEQQTRNQLLALMTYIRNRLLPAFMDFYDTGLKGRRNVGGDDDDDVTTRTASSLDSHSPKIAPHPPTSVLIGTLHTKLLTSLQELERQDKEKKKKGGIKLHRYDDPPYLKYLFSPSAFLEKKTIKTSAVVSPPGLPRHYTFIDPATGAQGVQACHYDLIIGRTHIPRSKDTLAKMVSVALYYDDPDRPGDEHGLQQAAPDPIAWAFLGLDGSLSTLHVEPEHRGRGLALFVAREVMRKGMQKGGVFFTEDPGGEEDEKKDVEGTVFEGGRSSDAWAHADVATENASSRRVMEKIGGRLAWADSWVVVELMP